MNRPDDNAKQRTGSCIYATAPNARSELILTTRHDDGVCRYGVSCTDATAPKEKARLDISVNSHDDNRWRPTECCTKETTPDTREKILEKRHKTAVDASTKRSRNDSYRLQREQEKYNPIIITGSNARTNWKSIWSHTMDTTLHLEMGCAAN